MEDSKITASQVLAMAAGPTQLAALNGSKVIRRTADGLKDLALPLKKILRAKAPDMQLQPDDVIWVPGSRAKGLVTGGTIVSMLTSLAIYRF